MSQSHFTFTRGLYDSCNNKHIEEENKYGLQWMTDASVQETQQPCFVNQSPYMQHIGHRGAPSSRIDVESDLRGQTRLLSRCAQTRFDPMANCAECKQCDRGLPCSCPHCKKTQSETYAAECRNGQSLVPEYTRTRRACNLKSEQNMYRFDHLCEDPQKPSRINENAYVGSNTRLAIKDAFAKKSAQ